MMKRLICLIAVVSVLGTMGCTSSYYHVKDPSTGKVYYTANLKQKSGATQLVNAKTGETVTIQNSEVREIPEEEFETARAQP